MKKIKGLIVRTMSHLVCAAIFFIIAFILSWLFPIVKPYAIFYAAIVSFFFGAMWDGGIFGLKARNFFTFLAEIAILVMIFLFSVIDHLFSLEIIPGIWRSLSLWPTLIAAFMSFLFFLFFIEYYDSCYGNEMTARCNRHQPA